MLYNFTAFPFKDSNFMDGIIWYGINHQCDEIRIDLNDDIFEMMFWDHRGNSYHYKINNYTDDQNYEYKSRW